MYCQIVDCLQPRLMLTGLGIFLGISELVLPFPSSKKCFCCTAAKAEAPFTLHRRNLKTQFYLCLLGLPSKLWLEKLSTENLAFWKRSSNRRNLNREHFVTTAFRKRWRLDNMWLTLFAQQSGLNTQYMYMKNCEHREETSWCEILIHFQKVKNSWASSSEVGYSTV